MFSNPTVYDVIPEGGAEVWVVRQDRGEFRGEFPSKQEAVDFATARARQQDLSQVRVHSRDGAVELMNLPRDIPEKRVD